MLDAGEINSAAPVANDSNPCSAVTRSAQMQHKELKGSFGEATLQRPARCKRQDWAECAGQRLTGAAPGAKSGRST